VAPGLLFCPPACLEHATGPDHPERADRIRAIERALAPRDWLGWERREAPPATREELVAVHAEEYVDRIRAMSEDGPAGALAEDTPVGPGSYAAAAAAAGAARTMVDALLAGDAAVGFCATRPPGHHARRDSTSGFCLVNHVAVAARHALDAHGLRRVFILDWDVHHGDGTHDIFRATDAVLFASIHQAGIFPGTGPVHDVGARGGLGFAINLPVEKGADEDTWVSLVEHIAVPAALEFRPELVLISAGYDAHRDDPQGGCLLDAGAYAEMARHVRALGERVGAPVGAVLEGGYALDALAESVCATLEALAGDRPPDSIAPDHVTARAASHIGHHWEL
jgi:acetoin utilization deacetylase AcuC-like enzyme